MDRTRFARTATRVMVTARGDRTVPYGEVRHVMGRVKAAGMSRVSMRAEGRTGASAIQAR